ncbi:MAG: hypothetical protein KGV44_00530 [Flavobacteriaceae bacterium]|nr:hypothetical protein [Flavobacteriaceae bacterium]
METFFTPIPLSLLLLLALQFVTTVVFIWLISKFTVLFIKNLKWKKRMQFCIPILRNFIGFSYIVYAIYMMLPYQPIFVLLVVILLVLLNWKLLQNFIQGTTYRLVKGNLTGTPMQVEGHQGKVVAMKDLHLIIQTSLGQLIQIPYTKLSHSFVIKSTEKEETEIQNLVVTIPHAQMSAQNLRDKITKKLVSFPWVIAHQPMEVTFEEKDSENTMVKVSYVLEDCTKVDYITAEMEQFLKDL